MMHESAPLGTSVIWNGRREDSASRRNMRR
jgi:hypothetical protein